MNSVRIGLITICAAAGASGWLSLRDTETVEAPASQTTRAPVTPFAASVPSLHSQSAPREAQATAIGEASAVRALASESDTTDLLAPTTPTLDELLDALDADIGEQGQPIDREAVGAWLRADPALSRMLRPAGT